MAAALLLRSLRPSVSRAHIHLLSHASSPTALGSFLLPRLYSSAAASTAASPVFTPGGVMDPSRIRNVAVIAHVDHGKTTLMDRLLRQCGADIPHERAMDSISLERERGITIASKVTSVSWKENELNMVDTPGHADFGGEVERVVGMVEGAVLVVDAGEGPLAQTKFVLSKALKYGLRPILLLNKVDRPSVSEETCDEVESLVFDLFANLGATEEQLDFPVLYASAKEGWASLTFTKSPPDNAKNMSSLLDSIVRHVPSPKADLEAPFQMLKDKSLLHQEPSPRKEISQPHNLKVVIHFSLTGRILTGRVRSGVVRVGDKVHGLRSADDGVHKIEDGKVVKLMKKKGTNMVTVEAAGAGDIISMAGLAAPAIGHTVANSEILSALPTIELDPPTISMTFGVNDSPLAGRDGTHLTGAKIGNRLMAEAETNLAINVLPGPLSESYEVQGRGELQLGILIENMRREGFELSVSPPKVMYKTERGERLEPIEEVTVRLVKSMWDSSWKPLLHRKGEVVDMGPVPGTTGRTRIFMTCPSRGLVGVKGIFSSLHGELDLCTVLFRGLITSHALMSLEARGILFVSPGMEAYEGMIVGEHSRDSDLEVNPVRTKELTNIRAPGKDENVRLSPPRLMSLEEAIGYVAADELIEASIMFLILERILQKFQLLILFL
ncbi:GTP-binding protein TypA/BipA [Zea mays]|uniref:GTP-binding protein TypA/BipA n=1 Tax=Zea mays TaxID=4577 RepID=A0A3L6D6D3_MAIZE|nr:GTP-binding protein TypA/BipA [Zea mays]